jgi:transcriptional regulator with XRE-family HTH domain
LWKSNHTGEEEATHMSLGDRLREAREVRALSQHGLAELSGVHFNTISGIESGKRKARPSTVRKLASALGVPVEKLTAGPQEEVPARRLRLPAGMAEYIQGFGLETDSYFTDVEISSEEVRLLYEGLYLRVLRAEKEGIGVYVDVENPRKLAPGLLARALELVEAVKKLPESDEKRQLKERIHALLEREVAVLLQEAERLEREELERREARRKVERLAREAREAEQELTGAA